MTPYSKLVQLSIGALAMMPSEELERHAATAHLHHRMAAVTGASQEADLATRTQNWISLVLSKRNRAIERGVA
jgi:hypothetical protein